MDMTPTLTPKSNQLNADDLIAGSRTITVTKVTAGNAEQPVAVYFEGDQGKPFYPCKSMRRVLVAAWGADASQYIGRRMTLYRDPDVAYGGIKVGGIRISHLSGLNSPLSIALTVTRQKRAPYKVQPLADPAPTIPAPATAQLSVLEQARAACVSSGLSEHGIHAMCLEASKGATDVLADLPVEILRWLATNGVKPEKVAAFNATPEAKADDDLPAAWAT